MQTETTPKTEVNAMLEVTAAQMKELERKANETGLSYEDMMENAGQAAARILLEQLPGLRTAAVVCGKGNNGGDGFVAARKLFEAGCCVRLYLVDGAPTAPGEARTNYPVSYTHLSRCRNRSARPWNCLSQDTCAHETCH